MQQVVNWEPFFQVLENDRIVDPIGLRRQHKLVNWQAMASAWRVELPQLAAGLHLQSGHFHVRHIHLPGGGRYVIAWDVTKAQSLIRDERIVPRRWRAADLKLYVATEAEGESPHLSMPGPIIWTGYPTEPPGVLIDGNHRVREAPADSWVEAYEIPTALMPKTLANNVYRRFYEWHSQISSWLWAEIQTQRVVPDLSIPDRFRVVEH